MKLYYSPGACSLAPIILAEWLGIPMKVEKVNLRSPDDAFLKANPLGAVPALILDDGTAMTQADAILAYLDDLATDTMMDGGDDIMERFEFHRWQAFLTGDYHPPFGTWFNPARYTSDHSETGLSNVKAATEERIRRVTNQMEAQIGSGNHVVLGRRTLLDAYGYAMLRWLRILEQDLEPWPNIARFLSTMEQDAGVQAALTREQSGQ